jgi:hypothetical protein
VRVIPTMKRRRGRGVVGRTQSVTMTAAFLLRPSFVADIPAA